MHKVKTNQGQSLFEVVFAIGIMALVSVAIVSVSTITIRNNIASKNKSLANKYVNEGFEWVRYARDNASSWDWFKARAGNVNPKVYCAGVLPPHDWGAEPSCNQGQDDLIPNTNLYRKVYLLRDGETVVQVKVSVTWTDSQGAHETNSYTNYTNWQ